MVILRDDNAKGSLYARDPRITHATCRRTSALTDAIVVAFWPTYEAADAYTTMHLTGHPATGDMNWTKIVDATPNDALETVVDRPHIAPPPKPASKRRT